MQSSDLKIHKLKDLYQLRYKDKNIICFHTDVVKTGEYYKYGATVNVTLVGHGLRVGESVFLDYTSGTAVYETLTITSITEDTFKCTSAASVTTAGTVNIRKENIVEHPNKELLEFIKDDLFKCGEFSLNSRNQIEHAKVNSAYILFSSYKSLQKKIYYEGQPFEKFIKAFYIFDLILVNNSNKNLEELNNARKIIKKMIGDEYFEELKFCAWGRFWNGRMKSFNNRKVENKFCDTRAKIGEYIKFDKNKITLRKIAEDTDICFIEKPPEFTENGPFISEYQFRRSPVSNKITKIYEDSTEFERIAILSLFHYSSRFSFLLPLAFIRGGLNKKVFLNALLVIKGDHLNEDKNLYDNNESRYKIYQEANELATLCKNFALIGTKEQKEIWEKVQMEENVYLEFKETFSMDAKKYRVGDFDTVKKKEQRKIIESNTLKAICALLNTEGGEIYIGVADKPVEIVGIKNEVDFLFKSSNDDYLLYLKALIKKNFSGQIKLIRPRIVEVFKKEIIIIKVKKSKKPVFFSKTVEGKKEKIFYIRNGPSSDNLDIEDFYNYIS